MLSKVTVTKFDGSAEFTQLSDGERKVILTRSYDWVVGQGPEYAQTYWDYCEYKRAIEYAEYFAPHEVTEQQMQTLCDLRDMAYDKLRSAR